MSLETNHISSVPEAAAETHQALDALLKQATETTDETPAAPEVKPPAEPAAVAEPAAPKTPDAPKADAAVTPEPPKADVAVTPPAPVKDALDEVALPPYSKPKTGEAFDKVKALARETIKKNEVEIARLNAELAAREEKLKAAPTPEQQEKLKKQEQELEELRNFRRATDIENDADFKAKFDGKIESNNKLILTKLTEAGMTKEQLEAIEKIGGVENVDWEPILENLPPGLRHLISAKLGNNIELREDRKAAVAAARKEPTQFETRRQETQAKALTETTNSFLAKMPWTVAKEIPATATPEQKAEITAHNALAKNAQDLIKSALSDFSPETFAELAIGTVQAHKFKADLTALKASSEAVAAKHTTDLDAITKERDALKTELDKIKKASKTHVRTSSAASPVALDQFANGAEALDRLRDSVRS